MNGDPSHPFVSQGKAAEDGSSHSTGYHVSSSKQAIDDEHTYAAHNYHPLPAVFARGKGIWMWDPEGKPYMDFLSAYSAVNQGHCHPELVKALTEQAQRLTLSSRAFYNDVFPRFAEKVTRMFGYDMALPMNTGAEAVETAVKIARKWAYKVKRIPDGEALVFSVSESFHGRTVKPRSRSVARREAQLIRARCSLRPSRCRPTRNHVTTTAPICPTSALDVRRPGGS